MGLTLGGPSSCFSDQGCNFSLASDVDLLVSQVQFIFDNLITGGNLGVFFNFSEPFNLHNGFSTPIVFNNQPPIAQSNLLPPVCGDGQEVRVRGVAIPVSGSVQVSPSLTMTLVRSPCVCTQISDVFDTTDQLSGCASVDATISIQGKLFEVTCGGGIPSPFVNQPAAVIVGLQDQATGVFYQYVAASTDGTGTFSVGFGVKNRQDVVLLIPEGGSKMFNLQAFFAGNGTHSRSNIFSTPLSISGDMGPACPLGSLVKDTVFETVPQGTEVHQITQGFVAGLVVGGVTLTVEDIASQVTKTVHDAIVTSGAVPVEIKVFRGPDVRVPAFFGFIGIPAASWNVVAFATGSPVAPLVIAAVIIIALAVLAFFIFLTFSVVKDIIAAGGGGVLLAGAVAIAVLGAAGLVLLLTQRRGISRGISRVTG